MKSGSKCNKTQMVDIECRTVLSHMSPKETGLDVECSLERGLICNAWKGEICPDFEIRVYCQCGTVLTEIFILIFFMPFFYCRSYYDNNI